MGSTDNRKFHLSVLTVSSGQFTTYFDDVSLNFTLLLKLSENDMNNQMISRKVWFYQYENESLPAAKNVKNSLRPTGYNFKKRKKGDQYHS